MASLRDLGYTVDDSQADLNYSPSALGPASATGELLYFHGDGWQPDVEFVD